MAEIKICCSHSKMVNIHELVEHPKNPNKHPAKQLEMLAKIIEAQGFRRPIVVSSRSGYVIIGHGRLQAARLLGMEQVPVDYQDYKTEAAEYADMVADNKIAELAEFDNTIFKDILKDIDDDFDMDLFGVKDNELNALLAENSADEVSEDNIDYESAIETARKNPRIQFGQVAVLGRHRLMCGDSTNALSVGQLMDGKLANMVFTDPPYNVNYQGNTKDKLKIKNDNMKPADFAKFLAAAMANLYEASAPGAAIYVCHADSAGTDFRQCMANAGWQVKQCLIWVKNSFVMGRQDYQWKHEPCLYGWKDGGSHHWYSDRKQTTVLNFDKPLRNADHPTMKPVPLFGYQIQNSSKQGDIILDTFGGSGTTLIACEQLGRKCRMMELDPHYCDVIIARWEKLTGNKAEKLGN